MAYKPVLSNFPQCCGIIIPNMFFKNNPKSIQDLGLEGIADAQARADKHNAQNAYTETSDEDWAKRVREFLELYCREYKDKKSYFLLTLNAKEAEVLEPVVLELGFQILVPDTHNPTGTSFTLYIYHLLSKKTEEAKSILGK